MPTPAQMLDACRRWLGYTENPPGSNCNRFSAQLGRPCERWCADGLIANADDVGLVLPSRSASTEIMRRGFRAVGRLHRTPQVGDFAFWQFDPDPDSDHVSIVESFTTTTVTTIDFNSSSGGSQSNGGEVCRRTRKRGLVLAYGRPAYATPTPPPPPAPPASTVIHFSLGGQPVTRYDQSVTIDAAGDGSWPTDVAVDKLVSYGVSAQHDKYGGTGDPNTIVAKVGWRDDGGKVRLTVSGGAPGAVDAFVVGAD